METAAGAAQGADAPCAGASDARDGALDAPDGAPDAGADTPDDAEYWGTLLEKKNAPDPTSNRSRKRAEKRAANDAKWQQAKARKKEQKQAARAEKPAERVEPDPNRDAAQIAADRLQRKQEREEAFAARCSGGPRIVIDFGFDDLMLDRELTSLAQQTLFCYGAMKKAAAPCRELVLASVGPRLRPKLEKHAGFGSWPRVCEQRMEDMDKAEVVYLSADAEEQITALDPNCAYVIGGIVDRNRLTGASKRRAAELGVRCARLPLEDHWDMTNTTPHLTVNACVDLLMHFRELGCWSAALARQKPGKVLES